MIECHLLKKTPLLTKYFLTLWTLCIYWMFVVHLPFSIIKLHLNIQLVKILSIKCVLG